MDIQANIEVNLIIKMEKQIQKKIEILSILLLKKYVIQLFKGKVKKIKIRKIKIKVKKNRKIKLLIKIQK